jgi:hypothetical protein
MSTTTATEARMLALKGVRAASLAVRDRLRAEKCTGPKFPGKPEDYSYRVSERCVPRMPGTPGTPGTPRAPRAVARGRAVGMSVAAAERELAMLDVYYAALYGKFKPTASRKHGKKELIHPWDLEVAMYVGHRLGSPEAVREHPRDIGARYDALLAGLELKAPEDVPRQFALLTHRSHLLHVIGISPEQSKTRQKPTKVP